MLILVLTESTHWANSVYKLQYLLHVCPSLLSIYSINVLSLPFTKVIEQENKIQKKSLQNWQFGLKDCLKSPGKEKLFFGSLQNIQLCLAGKLADGNSCWRR